MRTILGLLPLLLGGGVSAAEPSTAQEPPQSVDSVAAPSPDGTATASDPTAASGPESLTPAVTVDVPATPPAATTAATRTSPKRAVDEIVVTAQKREQNIQDVPISMAAFSGATLDARGIRDVAGLQEVTAGLQFGSYAGYPLIYLRGIGTDVFLPSEDPSVTTYIDGIYIPTSNGVVQSFGGIERVEVLKGPQGTLFGRNSVGGAISIVTRKPGDDFEASAQAVAGNFGERRAKAYVTGPITSWLAANADVIYGAQDHQYEQIDPDKSIHPERSLAGHTRINFHPWESFDFDVAYLKLKNKGTGAELAKNIDSSLLGQGLGITSEEDNRTSETDYIGGYKASHRLLTGTATLRLPWFDAKLIGSDQLIRSYGASIDFDASPQPIAIFATDNQFTDAQTAELQFVSNGGWGGESLEWVVGAYYLESFAGVDPGSFQGGPGALSYLNLPQFVIDLLDLGNGINPNNGVKLIIAGTMITRSVSEYVQLTWKALDWLDLTVGGRYQEEERQLLKTQTEIFLTEDRTQTLLKFPLNDASYKNFSPKAVVSVRPSEDWMVYLSGAKGFKSGTFNFVTLYSPGTYVKPETVRTFDLGTKFESGDGVFRFNAALFHSNVKDLHASFVSLTNGGAIAFENAGRAKIYGAEFDTTWVPLPSIDPGLVLTANAAYLHSRYTSFPDGSGFDPTTGVYTENNDFSGNTVVRSPKWTGGAGLVQKVPASWDGEFEFAVDGYWNSGFYYDSQNSVEENAYALLNARIAYLHRPWHARISVFGRNLLDEKYHMAVFQNDFGELSTLAYPAQYGVQLNLDF